MSQIRDRALCARRALSSVERLRSSLVICNRAMRSHEFMSAQTIGAYLPMADEVQTHPIIARAWRAQKRVAVPKIQRKGIMVFCEITPETPLVRSRLGIWEPAGDAYLDTRQLDMVITPVVAFDEDRHRIGMGGGYYDRTFRFLRNRRKWLSPKLIGVAFECQRAESIVPNSWDITLYRIVTEAS
jgi:5-formyltetrahydrofolate cyclo-ligase